MKKLLAFAVTGIMILGLTACGGGADVEPIPDDDYTVIENEDDDYEEEDDDRDEDYEEDDDDSHDGPTTYPLSEYGTDTDAMDYFIGYWEGNSTPPNVWYIFTDEGDVYCNRDNGYLEKGTYVVHDAGYAYITYENGYSEELFSIDYDVIGYDVTDGLSRVTEDDTVDQWILDEFAVSEPVYNEDMDDELNAELAGVYEGESGPFEYTYIFYADGSYEWASDGGAQQKGSYYFDGVTILTTPAGGGEIDEYTYDYDRIIDEYDNEFIFVRSVD